MKALMSLLKFTDKYRGLMLFSLILLLISSVLNMIQPKLIEWAIDFGIEKSNLNIIIYTTIGLFAAAVIGNITNFASGYILIKTGQGIGYDMRNTLYRKVMSFSFQNLDAWRTGELMVRMNSDVNTIGMFIRMGLLRIIQSLLMIAGGIVIMYMTNVKLASLMAVFMVGILLLFFFIAGRVRPLFLVMREKLDRLNNALQENLAGSKVVKAYNRQKEEIGRFNRFNKDHMQINLKVGYVISILFPMLMFIGNMAMFITLWVGGTDTISNILNPQAHGLTIGQFIGFNNYTMLIIFPILMLGMVLNFISMASASAERIIALLDEKAMATEKENPLEKERLEGKIEFRDVSFRYGEGTNVVDKVSVSINPGEKIGIIGTTASGKSSFAHLILRLYDPHEGSILIDGVDVKEYAFSTLRRRVAIVLQESLLFSGTIRENILFAKPDATEEEMERAAKLSDAYGFIMEKEKKWDEHIGERGTGLSGGQRQRIALARALITDPDVLILDDVTSSLDLETENRIIDSLYQQQKGSLIISQKVNTIKRADRILVFQRGQIIEAGTHDELMNRNGIYREIADTQSSQLYS